MNIPIGPLLIDRMRMYNENVKKIGKVYVKNNYKFCKTDRNKIVKINNSKRKREYYSRNKHHPYEDGSVGKRQFPQLV
jgi:hypothetical protein